MTSKNWIIIGTIVGIHGIRGLLKVKIFSESIDFFASNIFLSDSKLDNIIPAKIDTLNYHKSNVFLCMIQGVVNRNQAEKLLNHNFLINQLDLPKINPINDEYYYYELANMSIIDENGNNLGHVISVQNFGSDDLLEVKTNNDIIYLPFVKNIIIDVNRNDKIITINSHSVWINKLKS